MNKSRKNRIKYKPLWICSCFFILFFSSAKSQEVIPTYWDYLTDNLFLVYPSLAGAANRDQLRLTARQQWFDVEDAPGLQTLTVNRRLGNKEGIGAILFNDQNGNFSKSGGYAAFAYHLRLPAADLELHMLSFGISAGLIQHRLDVSAFEEPDPVLGGDNISEIYGNLDVGLSYFLKDLYIHFAAKNLLPINRELFNSEGIPVNQRRYFLTGGYIYSPSYDWFLEPSTMLQYGENTQDFAVDANLKSYRNFGFGQIWAGVSYRQGLGESLEGLENPRYLTPFAGVEFRSFIFGYTYSQQLNEIVLSNSGFHQITLGYNFGAPRARYHCGCPAIN